MVQRAGRWWITCGDMDFFCPLELEPGVVLGILAMPRTVKQGAGETAVSALTWRCTYTPGLSTLCCAMDFVEAEMEEIWKTLYFNLAHLLNGEVDFVFFDTRSSHSEVGEGDEGAAGKTWFVEPVPGGEVVRG